MDLPAVVVAVRNRGTAAAPRVIAWERHGPAHQPAPLASFERIEGGAAAGLVLATAPTARACHLAWTPDLPGAVRRRAEVPFLVPDGARA